MRRQRTIARSAEVHGFGYWSGQDVRVRFNPAPEDTGLVFLKVVKRLRKKAATTKSPTLEEITKEVESVRAKRYASKNKA